MKNLDIEGLNNETPREQKKDEQDGNVEFSSKLVKYFASLSKAFRSDHKISLTSTDLKKVYCHGARLGKLSQAEDINLYAMARVNMFMRLKSGDKMITSQNSSNEAKATELELEEDSKSKRASGFIDISESWVPNDDDIEKAQKEIDKNDLNHEYESIEDLYLEYKPIQLTWE
jgi:hypothetical protein